MNPSKLGFSSHSGATDHPMHLKARLVVRLQRELLRHSHTSLSGLAERLQTNQQILSDLLVLKTGNVTLSELRHFLLALNVPIQKIEACILSNNML